MRIDRVAKELYFLHPDASLDLVSCSISLATSPCVYINVGNSHVSAIKPVSGSVRSVDMYSPFVSAVTFMKHSISCTSPQIGNKIDVFWHQRLGHMLSTKRDPFHACLINFFPNNNFFFLFV